MVVPMMRPDVFGGLASHAGDALFECCYQPFFPVAHARCATTSRAPTRCSSSSWRRCRGWTRACSSRSSTTGWPPATRPTPRAPGKALLPYEIATGRLDRRRVGAVAGQGPRADGAHARRRAALDAPHLPGRGTRDEYYLDLGAQAFSAELDKLGVEHTLELFDAKHGGLQFRYPGAIRELVLALAP